METLSSNSINDTLRLSLNDYPPALPLRGPIGGPKPVMDHTRPFGNSLNDKSLIDSVRTQFGKATNTVVDAVVPDTMPEEKKEKMSSGLQLVLIIATVGLVGFGLYKLAKHLELGKAVKGAYKG